MSVARYGIVARLSLGLESHLTSSVTSELWEDRCFMPLQYLSHHCYLVLSSSGMEGFQGILRPPLKSVASTPSQLLDMV